MEFFSFRLFENEVFLMIITSLSKYSIYIK
jgi:hypothetical protein